MSNITRLPPVSKTVHVEAEIAVSHDEIERAMVEIIAGERLQVDALDRDVAAIKIRAMEGCRRSKEGAMSHARAGVGRSIRDVAERQIFSPSTMKCQDTDAGGHRELDIDET